MVDFFGRESGVCYFERVFEESEDGWRLGVIDADVCAKKAAFEAVSRKGMRDEERRGDRLACIHRIR